MTGLSTQSILSYELGAQPRLAEVVRPIAIEAGPVAPVGRRSLIADTLIHLPRVSWMLLDMLIACGGTVLGHTLFVWWLPESDALATYQLWVAGAILAASVLLAGSIIGLYENSTLWSGSRIVARCLITVTVAMAATWLAMHLFMYSQFSRRAAATGIVFFLVGASLVRLMAHRAVRNVRRGLLVIGQGPLTGRIIRSVRRGSVPGYRLVGIVRSGPPARGEHGTSDIPIVGAIDDIETVCRDHDVAEVVVADSTSQSPADLRAALACLKLGCRVTDETTFYESMYYEVPVSHITPNWFLAADLKGQRQEHAVRKRVFDVVIAGFGLLAAAPLFVLIAAIVRLREGGPVLYSQQRVGQGGRVFTLYKFRTMQRDAESEGTTWALANDPRVTRLGRVLRKSRLDELPQLWNILMGDMSVVGPRPERPEFVGPLCTLIPFYDQRHLMKPGLTGWAQISLGYGSSVADARRKLQHDLYYIKHMSLELDLIILLRTFGTFFLGAR